MTLADLAGYRVKLRDPVCGPYREYRVCGMPPPSSGGIAVLQMLGILEPFDVGAMGPDTFWSVHFMSEAGRLAYADRDQYVADPDFTAVPAGLLDPAYLRDALRSHQHDAKPRPRVRRRSAGTRSAARCRARTPRSNCRRPRTFPSSMATATRSR